MGHFSIMGRPLAPRPAFLPFLAPRPQSLGDLRWEGEGCLGQADASIPLLPTLQSPPPSIFRSIIVHSWVYFFFFLLLPQKKTDQIPPGKAISSPPELVRGARTRPIDMK